MKIIINGNQEDINGNLTVRELLAYKKVEMPDMVSVELNGAILKRSEFETIKIRENDIVEFLYFMGGGTFK